MNMQTSTFFLTVCMSVSSFMHAIDIYRIKEIARYLVNKRTLVIFDIDNTLLRPKTNLGSEQWFSHLVQERIQHGFDLASAFNHVLPLYRHVHLNSDMILTEQDLNEDIADIIDVCDHAICLTARSEPLAQRTIDQLHKHGLRFHVAACVDCDYYVPHVAHYKSGILFCGHNDKGDVLSAFLDDINYTPEVIIFVDDKEKNLHAVEVVAKRRNIEFIGLRYAGCDEQVNSFDYAETEQEWQDFLEQYPFEV